ncbi:hypothetical protein M408DRAFT_16736 [Serendipita vermifera MAFF 305830]|uniref:LAA1-like C-terminal TPR repeats domain-containing protein n=1 Tax=Serendipita vermifera MAFF 305830 TaxID=933852 RepID=A0A0C2WLF1_SERVB|nr:hypothetical protein M408DRAFT_16736 [Serendipita vermifera MAFF 305830]
MQDEIKPHISTLEPTLISIALSSSPFPSPPGRPIRSLVAKCLILLYGRGESRGLFDAVNKLLGAAGDLKEKDGVRVSAFYCAGQLMGHYGSQAMSFMMEFATSSIKVYKTSSASPLLRYHALHGLSQAMLAAGKALTDQAAKDIHKNMRAALVDKALPVQRAACEVLTNLFPNTTMPPPPSLSPSVAILSLAEIEAIIAQAMKALDAAEVDTATRLVLAKLVGHLLGLTQVPRATSATAKGPQQSNGPAADEASTAGAAKPQAEVVSRPLLQPIEMMTIIGTLMSKQSTTRKQRVGLLHVYSALFNLLGPSWVESNYALILTHLAKDLINAPKVSMGTRVDKAWIRKAVGILLRDVIGERMLSEQGIISSVMDVVNGIIRPFLSAILFAKSNSRPMSPTGGGQSNTAAFIRSQSSDKSPSADTMMIALKELAGLLRQLGNAPPVVQELLGGGEVLITVACSNFGAGVRGSAVSALCAFVRACPGRMAVIMETLHEGLKRDVTTLGTLATQMGTASNSSSSMPSLQEVKARALGHAYSMYGIYVLLATSENSTVVGGSVAPSSGPPSQARLLGISLHLHLPPISPTLLHTATSLLKSTLDQPLPIARINSEIGWTLLSGLMALGPQFVKPNLSALMVLWRNALPKPTVRDSAGSVGKEEWGFLLGVRGWAVGAMCAFLRWNNGVPGGDGGTGTDRSTGPMLVTLDISRRLGTLLSNALGFANLFITAQKEDVPDPTSPSASSTMMLSQVDEDGFDLQAYESLLRSHVHVAFSLLGFGTVTESVQRELITSTIGLFAGADSYGGSGLQAAIAAREGTFKGVWKCEDGYAYGVNSVDLDDLVRPIINSAENDSLALSSAYISSTQVSTTEAAPPSTAVVNTAIDLFALLLCSQDSNGALKAISGLLDAARMNGGGSIGRKMAVTINSVWSILIALRHVMIRGGTTRMAKEVFGGAQVGSILGDYLKEAVLDPDEEVRKAGSEALGRLASISSTTFLGTQINNLVKEVINNRDPNSRAGCASAFGAIFLYAGGLAAQPYLKTVLNVLMSLSNDPHPVVHYWALDALGDVVAASSLSYGPYISSTITMTLKIYMMETHEPEGGSLSQANSSGDLPSYQALCRTIDGLISAIGPELSDSVRSSTKIMDMVYQLLSNEEEGVGVEAIQCLRQVLMFAPSLVDIPDLVMRFRDYLSSPRRPMKVASINAIYQLVQRDAFLMSKIGGDKLVEVLFGMLDQDDSSSMEGVKNIITSWLSQTVTAAPSAWIDLCQRIMARTTASSQQANMPSTETKATGFQDDEAESLGAALPGGQSGDANKAHSTARWRTQLFAMECLHTICTVVAKSGKIEQLDLRVAKQHGIPVKGLLVSRIPDIVKMAFTASAAYVTEIRLGGLLVLKDIIRIFASSPDPDYDEALLLEQYQAPITAALTPAFSSDSTPEILSSAVQVCAIFVGCGVIKDVSKMGRILKLLTGALDQCKSSGSFSIGDVQQISPNAAVMLKISTLTAWAELLISSLSQEYLTAVIEPYRATLATLWIGALRDYASIRGDSEVMQESSSNAVDTLYLNLGKEVLLPYYDESWFKILKAVAIMMKSGDKYILSAMDGKEGATDIPASRDGPSAFFFVIFGLVYEALAQSSTNAASRPSNEMVTTAALEALESLVKPEYAGDAIMDSTIFDEFTSLCYRMAMMETDDVHVPLVRAIASLASTQCSRSGKSNGDTSFNGQLTHCLRICAYILRRALPSVGGGVKVVGSDSRVLLLKTSFGALAQIGGAFGAANREDIRGISIALYSELLKDEISEYDLVGPTLPALKSMLDIKPSSNGADSYAKLIHGLISCCLQNIEETVGRSGPTVTIKTKNNLLAAVLILTIIPPTTKLSRALVEQCCYLISQRIMEQSEVTVIAAHCARTLITASLAPNANPALRHCAGLLVPSMITLVSTVAAHVDDPSPLTALTPALDEALKALAALFTGVPEDSRAAALGVILPTLALLLDTSRSPPSSLHTQTVPIVLNLATSAPVPFKEVTEKLEPAVRETLETAVRNALASRQQTSSQSSAKPQISLKAF